jgi:hypothetical protein
MDRSTYDLRRFHHKLLEHGSRAPKRYWLTDVHAALYDEHRRAGIGGYVNTRLDDGLFLGTYVLAVALTEIIHPVYVFAPEQHMFWVVDAIERINAQVFRCRQGRRHADAVQALRGAIKQLRLSCRLHERDEPERWVMFGFTSADPLPSWAADRLLDLPRAHEARALSG